MKLFLNYFCFLILAVVWTSHPALATGAGSRGVSRRWVLITGASTAAVTAMPSGLVGLEPLPASLSPSHIAKILPHMAAHVTRMHNLYAYPADDRLGVIRSEPTAFLKFLEPAFEDLAKIEERLARKYGVSRELVEEAIEREWGYFTRAFPGEEMLGESFYDDLMSELMASTSPELQNHAIFSELWTRMGDDFIAPPEGLSDVQMKRALWLKSQVTLRRTVWHSLAAMRRSKVSASQLEEIFDRELQRAAEVIVYFENEGAEKLKLSLARIQAEVEAILGPQIINKNHLQDYPGHLPVVGQELLLRIVKSRSGMEFKGNYLQLMLEVMENELHPHRINGIDDAVFFTDLFRQGFPNFNVESLRNIEVPLGFEDRVHGLMIRPEIRRAAEIEVQSEGIRNWDVNPGEVVDLLARSLAVDIVRSEINIVNRGGWDSEEDRYKILAKVIDLLLSTSPIDHQFDKEQDGPIIDFLTYNTGVLRNLFITKFTNPVGFRLGKILDARLQFFYSSAVTSALPYAYLERILVENLPRTDIEPPKEIPGFHEALDFYASAEQPRLSATTRRDVGKAELGNLIRPIEIRLADLAEVLGNEMGPLQLAPPEVSRSEFRSLDSLNNGLLPIGVGVGAKCEAALLESGPELANDQIRDQ